jgi:hypothetical protein
MPKETGKKFAKFGEFPGVTSQRIADARGVSTYFAVRH